MGKIAGFRSLVVLLGVLWVGIGLEGAERIGRPEIYPEEDLEGLEVARPLSPAEMRAGIEAALKIPDWKPSDPSKSVNNWTPVGGTILSPTSWAGHDTVGRVRCAAWAWSNGLGEETLWVGASSGGLWMLGRNPLLPSIRWWVPVSKTLPGSPTVGAFLVKPGDSNYILIGTGDPGRDVGTGLYRTTNGGTTWTYVETATPDDPSCFYKLMLDPGDPSHQKVFAATSLGLFVSFDFGASWNRLNQFSDSRITDVVRETAGSDYLVAIADGRISRCSLILWNNDCTDATGLSGNIGRISLAVSPSDPSYVFALVSDDIGYDGVYRSSDGGSSFVNIDDHFGGGGDPLAWGQAWHTGAIAVDPANPDRVIVGMAAAQMSFNATAADPSTVCWRRNKGVSAVSACDTTGLDAGHADQTSMSFVPQSVDPGNTDILITNDGGIFTYDWSADTFDDSYNDIGLNVSQVTLPRTMDRSRTNPNRLLAGLQDNGIMRINLDGNPAAYEGLTSSDGGQVSIRPNIDDDFSFILGSAFDRYRWIGTVGTLEHMNVNLPGDGSFNMTMAYNHSFSDAVVLTHDARYLYYRWVWEDSSVDWRYVNPNHPLPASVEISNIDTASDDSLTIYITDAQAAENGTAPLYIMTGTLGDMNWVASDVDGGMVSDPPAEGRVFADRSGSSANGDHVYFTTGRNRPSRAYFSTDHGTTWWQVSKDLETVLPNVDFWQLLSHPDNHADQFLATEVGIFRRHGTHWYRYMDGLPAVVKVRAMQIHSNGPDDTELVIGTWGNGLWKRQVEFDDHIFGDGFEWGSTGHWDATVGE